MKIHEEKKISNKLEITLFKPKCSDRSMEVKLLALLENCERPTDDRRTDRVIWKFHIQSSFVSIKSL